MEQQQHGATRNMKKHRTWEQKEPNASQIEIEIEIDCVYGCNNWCEHDGMWNRSICVFVDENVTFHVDAHVPSLSSASCIFVMTMEGLSHMRMNEGHITMSSANSWMLMYCVWTAAMRSWM